MQCHQRHFLWKPISWKGSICKTLRLGLPFPLRSGNCACLMITRTCYRAHCSLLMRRNGVFIAEVELLYSLWITFREGMFPLGLHPPPMLPNWSRLHKFTKEAKTPAGASYILQRHLKVANSKLKCVIQYYMSSQLRKDVNCKWNLGGQEAEALFSLPPGDICKLSRCWVSSSSAVINENWEGSARPV